ncbi:MAG: DUF3592 domain-containing protein [Lentisphaeria bacterium]|nr:DUF3592 domain-containing protein [Lentisphaeria bacterium]NQZ70551.1 DUF3592 domain-containing protein [Lentisphaeria bacterium]
MAKKGKEEKTGEWPIMLLGLIFFITGIVPLAYAVMEIYTSFEMRHWQRADAVIISSDIKRKPSGFKIEFDYSYKWKGADFTSHQKEDDDYTSKKIAEDFLKRFYQPEQKLACYLNSNAPSEVQIGKPYEDWFDCFWKTSIIAIWTLIGFLIFHHGIKTAKFDDRYRED